MKLTLHFKPQTTSARHSKLSPGPHYRVLPPGKFLMATHKKYRH